MANFATLADAMAGCTTQVVADACNKLFAAATPPTGAAPSDTLTAAQSIARHPWYKPERLFAFVGEFYPTPTGENLRPVPFMPYLAHSPSAWVLPLKFDGGGYRAGGKAMFDSEGNLGSAIISQPAGRALTRCGRATPRNSFPTPSRSRRSPPASPVAGARLLCDRIAISQSTTSRIQRIC